ncbi:hypothetical protein FB451DRAFT_1195646 [Mycena latifolia]|nr:hypothetical protein FB451DRAFT_1195646 [Mycena latifolia]
MAPKAQVKKMRKEKTASVISRSRARTQTIPSSVKAEPDVQVIRHLLAPTRPHLAAQRDVRRAEHIHRPIRVDERLQPAPYRMPDSRKSMWCGRCIERKVGGVGRHGEHPHRREPLARAETPSRSGCPRPGGARIEASQAPLERRYTPFRVIFKLCAKCSRGWSGSASSSEKCIRLLGGEGKPRLRARDRRTSRSGIHTRAAHLGTSQIDARATWPRPPTPPRTGIAGWWRAPSPGPDRKARPASRDVRTTRKRESAFAKPCGCMQPVSHSPPARGAEALPWARRDGCAQREAKSSPACARIYRALPTFCTALQRPKYEYDEFPGDQNINEARPFDLARPSEPIEACNNGLGVQHTAKSRSLSPTSAGRWELDVEAGTSTTIVYCIRPSWAASSLVWHFQCMGQRLRSGQRSILEFQYFTARDLQARIQLAPRGQLQVSARRGNSFLHSSRLEGSVDSVRRTKTSSARRVGLVAISLYWTSAK